MHNYDSHNTFPTKGFGGSIMGKYGNIERQDVENQDVFEARMIQAFANELAESNRLKRWELLNKHKHVDDKEGIYYSINEKELEDQA